MSVEHKFLQPGWRVPKNTKWCKWRVCLHALCLQLTKIHAHLIYPEKHLCEIQARITITCLRWFPKLKPPRACLVSISGRFVCRNIICKNTKIILLFANIQKEYYSWQIMQLVLPVVLAVTCVNSQWRHAKYTYHEEGNSDEHPFNIGDHSKLCVHPLWSFFLILLTCHRQCGIINMQQRR